LGHRVVKDTYRFVVDVADILLVGHKALSTNNRFLTLKRIAHFYVTENNTHLFTNTFRKIIVVYSENLTKSINTDYNKN
jgi:hypothetical protein